MVATERQRMEVASAAPKPCRLGPIRADSGTFHTAPVAAASHQVMQDYVPECIPLWIATLAEFAASAKDFVDRCEYL